MTHFSCPNCGSKLLVGVESEAVQPAASEIRARARRAVWHFLARGGPNPDTEDLDAGMTAHDAHTRYLYWAQRGGFMYLSQRMFSTSALAYGARFKLVAHQKRQYWFPGAGDMLFHFPVPELGKPDGDVGPVPGFEPWQLAAVREDDFMWVESMKDDLVRLRKTQATAADFGIDPADLADDIAELVGMLEWSRDNRFRVPAGYEPFNPPRWALPDTAYSWTV